MRSFSLNATSQWGEAIFEGEFYFFLNSIYITEVAEVEIAASEGRRSGQGPGEKKIDQKF